MSDRFRLLTVSNFFELHRGGLEIVAGRLAAELADRGFDVTWLASSVTPPPEGVRAIGVGVWNVAERRLGVPWPILSPAAVATLWRAVGAADAVLLHDSLYMTSVVAFLAARVQRKPLVIVQHIGAVPYRSALLRRLMALANRFVAGPVLAGADQVVFISQFVRDYFAGLNFKSAPRLIFNGVDTVVFHPPCGGERLAARARFGLGANQPIALFVGRFVEKKGVGLLRLVAQRRPHLTFAFAGWGVLDPASWSLPNVRVFSDLSGPGLADLYRASDLFALPSRGEGFPLVVQEALACGLPVVCGAETVTADPDAEALLVGVDVAGADDELIAENLALAIDATLACARAEDAKHRAEFVRGRYAWSAVADRYAEILTALIAGRPEAGAVA